MATLIAGVVVWLACGLVARAMCLADFYRIGARPSSQLQWLLVAVGPVGLLTALSAATRPYGLRWWID
jgi:hypothetical protein